MKKIRFQPEDDNDHMSRVGAMIRSFIEENYMYDNFLQELARRRLTQSPISASFLNSTLTRILLLISPSTALLRQKSFWSSPLLI